MDFHLHHQKNLIDTSLMSVSLLVVVNGSNQNSRQKGQFGDRLEGSGMVHDDESVCVCVSERASASVCAVAIHCARCVFIVFF
jgi:hypothetical protein